MAMAMANDMEDFVTCGVCSCKYDEDIRKPKFLPCTARHTACLLCLKDISKEDLITCPFCRDTFAKIDVDSLPNNPYVLHMLKFKEKKEEPPKPIEVVTTPLAISWCLTCGSAEKPGCAPSRHSSVNMTADIIRDLEALLKLKEELMKMKDIGMNQLTVAIQERQKVQEQLALVMKGIQCSENEVKKLQDENSFHISQMVSVLERNKPKTDVYSQNGQPKRKLYFSELMSFVEGSTADDTAETLKKKMTKSIELYEQEYHEATALVSEYELRNKMKISVHVFDENDQPIPTCSWLEKGFRYQPITPALKMPQNYQDSILLSHVIFSALKRHKIPLKRVQQPANTSATSTTISLPPSVFARTSKFDSGSIFILRLFQSGVLKGEIHIRPMVPFCYPAFLQQLGEFCFQSQKKFGSNIDKALAEVCVLLKIVHSQPQFQSALPNTPQFNIIQKAARLGEVGVIFSKNTASEWSFIFPLKEFQNPKQEVHIKSEINNQLFGYVTDLRMMECVTQLGKSKKAERSCYTLTLESQ